MIVEASERKKQRELCDCSAFFSGMLKANSNSCNQVQGRFYLERTFIHIGRVSREAEREKETREKERGRETSFKLAL